MLPTPDLAHLSCRDFECVYEPAGKEGVRLLEAD